MIIKSLPASKPVVELSQGSVVIGDTLFVNGTPYKFCGKCGGSVAEFSGTRTNISGRKVQLTQYKITIMAGWVDEGEEIIYRNGFPEIKRHKRPIIIQKLGCFDCWHRQQMRKNHANDKDWMYDIRECFNPKTKPK